MARVREVIRSLGYESSLVAQSLRSRQTNVIGILVKDVEPFSAELLKGAASRGPRLGLRPGGLLGLRQARGRRGVGAALPVPHQRHPHRRHDPGHAVERRRLQAAPVVAVDHNVESALLPTVDSDNLAGAMTATEHLLEPRASPHRVPGRPPRPRVGPAARARVPRRPGPRRDRARPRAAPGRRLQRRGGRGPGAAAAGPADGRPRSSPPTTPRPSAPSRWPARSACGCPRTCR